MSHHDQDWDDPDDFDDEDAGDEEGEEEWSEEQWEAYLRKEDERHQKLMELLDKHGHDEKGFRKAMEELGYGEVFRELDRRAAERQEPPEEEMDHVDKVLWESRLAAERETGPHYRHPLGQAAHELTYMVLKALDGHDEIDSRDHPLAVFSGAYLDATGNLAGIGYMREWDDDFDLDLDTPKNLKIVEIKRAQKNFVKGLGLLETIERQGSLPAKLCTPIRLRTVALLDELRAELRQLRGK